MKNTEALLLLTDLLATPRPRGRKRPGQKRDTLTASPPGAKLHKLEHMIVELVEPIIIQEELSLTWEQREAAGIAELLRIYQDALLHPMSDADLARSELIVAALNEHRPPINP